MQVRRLVMMLTTCNREIAPVDLKPYIPLICVLTVLRLRSSVTINLTRVTRPILAIYRVAALFQKTLSLRARSRTGLLNFAELIRVLQ